MNPAEKELIEGCLKRDRKAQYAFYKLYFSYLFSICLRYTHDRDEAMSIVNLSFARIMLNLNKYDRDQPLKYWVRRVTVNCIIDEFRKNKLYSEHIDQGIELNANAHSTSADFEQFGNNLSEIVQSQLSKLSPVTRSVFNLHAVDGYKHREIAEMLQITEGTSAWHLSLARKTIQDFLSSENKHIENGRATA